MLAPVSSTGVGCRIWSFRITSTLIPRLSSPRKQPALHFSGRRTLLTTCSTPSPSSDNKRQKVIVISGPTGAGKSKLALEVAKRINGEIISADSVQVYQGLNVGSAKPLPSDREEVPHHLIDILHPSEDYSAGQFFEDARQATKDILGRGSVPIVTGGTGLYLRWYIYGKPDVPKSSAEIDSEVFSELVLLQKRGDWNVAVQLVEKAGDPRARYLACNDWYRLKRSLEIIKATGSPPCAFPVPYDSFKEQLDTRTSMPPPDDNIFSSHIAETLSKDLDYDFFCFFLSSQRIDLYRRIDLRCEEMLTETEGLLSEATWLLELGLLPNMNSATRAIGYRQAMEYLSHCGKSGGHSSPNDFLRFLTHFQKASRNFAKRQMTWFRNEHIYQWLDASQPMDIVLEFILDAYNDQSGQIVIPSWLKIEKDVCSRRETLELKTYRTKNRLFVRPNDCSHILDWVWRRQRKLASVRS